MTNEQMKVLELVDEMDEEEKKTVRVPHYYKRNGKMLRRSYDDTIETERYRELFYGKGGIRGVKVFRCYKCGEMVDYFDLEHWCCDFDDENGCICSLCYEEELGDDL